MKEPLFEAIDAFNVLQNLAAHNGMKRAAKKIPLENLVDNDAHEIVTRLELMLFMTWLKKRGLPRDVEHANEKLDRWTEKKRRALLRILRKAQANA
jgi:hypothetical protein